MSILDEFEDLIDQEYYEDDSYDPDDTLITIRCPMCDEPMCDLCTYCHTCENVDYSAVIIRKCISGRMLLPHEEISEGL